MRLHSLSSARATPAQSDGRWMIRVSIGALATERLHVEQLQCELYDVVD